MNRVAGRLKAFIKSHIHMYIYMCVYICVHTTNVFIQSCMLYIGHSMHLSEHRIFTATGFHLSDAFSMHRFQVC